MNDLPKLDIHWGVGTWVRVFDDFFGECKRFEVKAYDPADGFYTLQNATELIWRKGESLYDDECAMLTRAEIDELKRRASAATAAEGA